MKCKKCKQDLEHFWYGSRCGRCEPIDIDVGTCKCGGIQDEYSYIEYDDYGGGEVTEYRCRVCQESEEG